MLHPAEHSSRSYVHVSSVGTKVGDSDGVLVGTSVGDELGTRVGTALGTALGLLLGRSVGCFVAGGWHVSPLCRHLCPHVAQ